MTASATAIEKLPDTYPWVTWKSETRQGRASRPRCPTCQHRRFGSTTSTLPPNGRRSRTRPAGTPRRLNPIMRRTSVQAADWASRSRYVFIDDDTPEALGGSRRRALTRSIEVTTGTVPTGGCTSSSCIAERHDRIADWSPYGRGRPAVRSPTCRQGRVPRHAAAGTITGPPRRSRTRGYIPSLIDLVTDAHVQAADLETRSDMP